MPDSMKVNMKFSAGLKRRLSRSWVKLVPTGEIIDYDGREIEFSGEYLEKIVAENLRLNQYFDARADAHGGSSYRFPVLLEHRASGTRQGDLIEVKLASESGFTGLWGLFEWTEPTALAIQKNQVKHVSVGILPEYQVENGDKFGPVVNEVSLTVDQRLNSIGAIQDTLNVQLSKTAITKLSNLNEDDMDELVEILNEIVARMEKMEESIAKLGPELEEPETDEFDGDESETPDTGETPEEEPEEPEEPVVGEAPEEEPMPIAASQFGKLAETLSIQLGRMEARLDDIEKRPPVRLNTAPKGRQGLPPAAPKSFDTFDDRVDHLKKKKGMSHLDATRAAFKATQ